MNKEVRLVLSSTRDEDTIKNFVQDYIENGNTIITDAWRSYNFLDNADSEIQHLVHNHGHGDFDLGQNSTSHIEQCIVQQVEDLKTRSAFHQPCRRVREHMEEAYIDQIHYVLHIRSALLHIYQTAQKKDESRKHGKYIDAYIYNIHR